MRLLGPQSQDATASPAIVILSLATGLSAQAPASAGCRAATLCLGPNAPSLNDLLMSAAEGRAAVPCVDDQGRISTEAAIKTNKASRPGGLVACMDTFAAYRARQGRERIAAPLRARSGD